MYTENISLQPSYCKLMKENMNWTNMILSIENEEVMLTSTVGYLFEVPKLYK